MADYISASDLTDKVINSFPSATRTAKITLSTTALNDLAATKGVDSDSIETDPVHYLVKQWCIAWVGMEICFDHMGTNNNEFAEQEKYRIKYREYRERVNDLTSQITPQVLYGSTDSIRDRATVKMGILFRG